MRGVVLVELGACAERRGGLQSIGGDGPRVWTIYL